MARLLVDMNLSTEWIPLLRASGHWAVHWSEVGDPRAPDTALMQWAIANGCAIFTPDLDFGTMLALSGADGPSVLQVRCLNVLPGAIGPLVLSLLKAYGAEFKQGALSAGDCGAGEVGGAGGLAGAGGSSQRLQGAAAGVSVLNSAGSAA